MRIEGQQTFAAGRDVLWSLLHDPVTLARVLPGCESLQAVSTDEFRGTFALRVGQLVETFTGTLLLSRAVPPQSYDFQASGNNPEGAVTCRGRVTLHPEGPDSATLAYTADIEVSGRPAQLTERMLQTTARSYARRSLETLEQQVAIRTRVYTTTVAYAPGAWGAAAANRASSPSSLERLVFRRRLITAALLLLVALFISRRAGNRRERLVAAQVTELLEQSGLATPTPVADSAAGQTRDIA